MLKQKYLASILVGLLLMSIASVIHAAGEIKIFPLERYLETNGRGIISLSFTVNNQSGSNQRLVERLELPSGWKSLSSLAPFRLSQGEKSTRLVHVAVPKVSRAGTFSVRYFVRGMDDININGFELFDVRVSPVTKLVVSGGDIPNVLLAGDSYDVVFRVKNIGNREEALVAAVRDEDGFVKTVSPRHVTIKPGQESIIRVSGKIPSKIYRSRPHRFTFIIGSGRNRIEKKVNIPTMLRTPVGLGKYHKLKGWLSLGYLADDSIESNWRLSYQGQGFLDSRSKHWASVSIRSADKSGLSSTDQGYYKLGYRVGDWATTLGDQGFYTDSLSGHGLTGVGLSATYSPRNSSGQTPLTIRAFQGKSRSSPDERVKGGGIKYSSDKGKFQVGLSLINHVDDDGLEYTVRSVSGAWSSKYATLRGGYARDDNDHGVGLDLNYNWKNLGINATHRQGGSQFTGGYRDSRENQIGINWRYKENTVRVTAAESRNNLDNNPTTSTLKSDRYSITLGRSLGKEKNAHFLVGYRSNNEVDVRVADQSVDKTVEALFLEYQHSFSDIDLVAKWEQGKRDDRLSEGGKGSRQQLAANWRATDKLDLRLTYSKNNGLNFSGVGESYGLNGSYNINGRQRVSGYWQKHNGEASSSDSIGLSYSHRFLNRHSISLNAAYSTSKSSNSGEDEDNQISLSYSLPLDVPIRRRRDVGSIRGHAAYQGTGSPAKNLTLKLGRYYAVTDNEGHFFYPDILAKKHSLVVDTSRGEASNYILNDTGTSMVIDVKPNEVNELRLSLQPGSSIAGYLKTFGIDKESALQGRESVKELAGLSGVLIELRPMSSHLERNSLQRVLTGSDGEFNFFGLPPGEWQVVLADKLPQDYRVEQRAFTVSVDSGETREVTFKAKPRSLSIERIGPSNGFNVSG